MKSKFKQNLKSNQLTLLDSIKLLKVKSSRRTKVFPITQMSKLLRPMAQVNSYALGRVSRLSERVRISHNLFKFIQRMSKHHGDEFTIKWLKASHVALQKYLAGDPLTSLRSLEPALPLPRLINGCPPMINRRDRFLMRSGNHWIMRYWLSQFGIYRVLKGPMKLKLETITAPFSGDAGAFLDLMAMVGRFRPFSRGGFDRVPLKSPTTLILSHKSSPSNRLSYQGLVTDYSLLKYPSDLISNAQEGPTREWLNIQAYVACLKASRLPMAR
jgi:hypothetical protein